MARGSEIENCPECGAEFRRGRLACPACGSDAATGWKDETEIQYQGVDIPDSYEELIGADATPRRSSRAAIYFIAAVLALLGMLLFALLR